MGNEDKTKEAPEVHLGFNNRVFPFANLEDALEGLLHAQEHFDQRFRVSEFRGGYVKVSEEYVIDARGLALRRNGPGSLPGEINAYHEVLRESTPVKYRK